MKPLWTVKFISGFSASVEAANIIEAIISACNTFNREHTQVVRVETFHVI